MESNWRFNVWATGWAYSQYKLVARERPPFDTTYYATVPASPAGNHVYRGVADMQGYVNQWFYIGSVYANGFPYGLNVFPD